MKDDILKYINNYCNKTVNKSGITLIMLKASFEIELTELKDVLNELAKEKKIKVKPGVNHKLIFKKE